VAAAGAAEQRLDLGQFCRASVQHHHNVSPRRAPEVRWCPARGRRSIASAPTGQLQWSIR
jgi:hypothetical protein